MVSSRRPRLARSVRVVIGHSYRWDYSTSLWLRTAITILSSAIASGIYHSDFPQGGTYRILGCHKRDRILGDLPKVCWMASKSSASCRLCPSLRIAARITYAVAMRCCCRSCRADLLAALLGLRLGTQLFQGRLKWSLAIAHSCRLLRFSIFGRRIRARNRLGSRRCGWYPCLF